MYNDFGRFLALGGTSEAWGGMPCCKESDKVVSETVQVQNLQEV